MFLTGVEMDCYSTQKQLGDVWPQNYFYDNKGNTNGVKGGGGGLSIQNESIILMLIY